MAAGMKCVLFIFVLLVPSSFLFFGNDQSLFVRAEDAEDTVEGEEMDDGTTVEPEGETVAAADMVDDAVPEEEDKGLKPSPDADTKLMFIKPTNLEFPAGSEVNLLVGFLNRGKKDFIVDSIDAAFRYPQDYSYFIQNFSASHYQTLVEVQKERSFQYSFIPSDQFPTRPFGLTINLNYRDNEGNQYIDAVFNETVNIVELDEGLDGETFFLYVMMVALVVLLLLGLQQLLVSFSKKRLSQPKKPAVEMGTQNSSGIDFDWIPKEVLNKKSQSPRTSKSPKSTPPRQRRTKGTTNE